MDIVATSSEPSVQEAERTLRTGILAGREDALNDLYTDTNVIWDGHLQIFGQPGAAPAPEAQGVLDRNGYAAFGRTAIAPRLPRLRSSSPVTAWPSSSSRRAAWDPM